MIEAIFLTLVCLIPLIGHPLTLGFVILRISSFLSIILCKLVLSWFGYRIFLVYVGGILVMFSYVVALAPNITGFNTLFFIGLGSCLFLVNLVLIYVVGFGGLIETDAVSNLYVKGGSIVYGLFNSKNIIIIIFLLLILLITMIIVVKICYYRSGPLRPFS